MTLTIDLTPEQANRLQQAAARCGMDTTAYLHVWIERGAEVGLPSAQEHTRSILEFEGVGAANPVGKDPQDYVNEMRDEWDSHV